MSWGDYLQLAPIWILNFGAIAVMLQITLRRSELLARGLTLATLVAALGFVVYPATPPGASNLFLVDGLSRFSVGLIVLATLAVVLITAGYFERREKPADEYYILLLLAAAGAGVMAMAGHLIPFYLGLEILSVSLFGLIAYERQNSRSTEAAIKYLLLAAVTASFFLFGAALVYAQLGRLDLNSLSQVASAEGVHPVLLAGLGLMLVGIAFKLSLVPFHSWAPDVYEGAPMPIAAFFSTVSKAAMLAFVLRLFAARASESTQLALAVLAVLSMLGGNLLALRQSHVKRLLAYSSSAHMGYALVPLVVGGRGAGVAATAYLAVYAMTSLAAFGALAVLLVREPWREMDGRFDLRGLRATQPWLCLVLAVALLSLAGMPFTAGFFGKIVVMNVGVRGAAWATLAALALGSVLGAYYYLRLLIEACSPLPGTSAHHEPVAKRSWANAVLLGVLTLALVGLGIFPERAIQALSALLYGHP